MTISRAKLSSLVSPLTLTHTLPLPIDLRSSIVLEELFSKRFTIIEFV